MDRCSNLKVAGIYSLIIYIAERICNDIGALGHICIDKGLYTYIGSARGFGGIEARVRRHIAKDKRRMWWHIDYITNINASQILYIVYAETVEDLEYKIATALSKSSCWVITIPRFGSSDKRSITHLFRCICNFNICLNEIIQVFRSVDLEPCIHSFNNKSYKIKTIYHS